MTHPTPILRRRSRAIGPWLAIACAILAVAWFRTTVYFSASFDVTGSPGGTPPLTAEVGKISKVAPPFEFQVVPDPSGGGQLAVTDAGTGSQDAVLKCQFDKSYKGQSLCISWSFRQNTFGGPVVVRLADDVDAGMIDVEYDGDGNVLVAHEPVGHIDLGTEYDFELDLKDPLAGPASWSLSAVPHAAGDSAPGGWSVVGALPKGLVTASLLVIRPANSPSASYLFDDLRAENFTPTVKN